MRLTRVVRHPLTVLTAGVVVAAVAFRRAVPLALVGELVGLLAGLLSLQVGLLVGAVLLGVRVHRVVVGVGPRLVDWTRPRRVVAVRLVPVVLSVAVSAGRAPRRLWGAALCSAVAGVVTAVATMGVGLGFSIACTGAVAYALVPRKRPGSTSTGWLLTHLWRQTEDQAEDLAARAVDAVQEGDLVTASELAGELYDRHPGERSTAAVRALVLEAQGRYAEAMLQIMAMAGDMGQTPRQAASSFASLAGAAYTAIESGQVARELALGTADQAVADAETLGYPAYKLNGCRALRALVVGEPQAAIRLARLAADSCDDRLGRADDLATLARAHMVAGDNRAARAALAEAERIVPWWPRVVETRKRLDVGK